MSELFKLMGRTFLAVASGALFGMAFIVSVFSGGNPSEVLISAIELWRILLIALFSALTCLITYSPRELGARQMLIRKIMQFIVVLAAMVFFALKWEWIIPSEDIFQSISFVGIVIAVFLAVKFLEYYRDKQTAEALNRRLNEYRQRER